MVLSIITIVYNGADRLEDTIKSVLVKKNEKVEYIIIDGGSKDGTLHIINKFSDKIDHWVSEPDNGIYDAMNKGIQFASGIYICFINSGDTLKEIPFEQLASAENADMICFPITINSGRIKYPKLNWKFKITNTLPHQGVFYKKQSSLQYNTRYKVFADYALNADYVLGKKNIRLLSSPVVANHNLDGISNNKTSSKELFEMIKEKFGLAQLIASFLYFKFRGLYYRFHLLCF